MSAFMSSLNFGQALLRLWEQTGFQNTDWRMLVMLLVGLVMIYLAIVKKFEPLLLLPIAFGILIANMPAPSWISEDLLKNMTPEEIEKWVGVSPLMAPPIYKTAEGLLTLQSGLGTMVEPGGLLYYLYQGVKLSIFPPLIFLGIGCMTDFGPLIANPKSLLLGAAAQMGVFLAFLLALVLGFGAGEAASIGIIGGADGPTAIYTTNKLAPHLLASIAIAAYSYMALIPVIQKPIMRLMTTKKERAVVMGNMRVVSQKEKIVFPILVVILVGFLLPAALPLVGMLMLGNLFRESGVVGRLVETASNALINIITIFLGLTVGATASGHTFIQWGTLGIIALGVLAFGFGTVGGLGLGKLMYKLTGGKVNPLIGSAGVSAVPMAARVSQEVGQQENPHNFLLMHAMGPNVAGVLGSAVAAGVFLALFGS